MLCSWYEVRLCRAEEVAGVRGAAEEVAGFDGQASRYPRIFDPVVNKQFKGGYECGCVRRCKSGNEGVVVVVVWKDTVRTESVDSGGCSLR
jgi:hypothetical protein